MKDGKIKALGTTNELIKDIRSREINVAENNDKKDKPNTAIPGVNCFSEKGVAGIFFWIVVNSNKITIGKPKPKIILIGSRKISFVVLLAKAHVLIFSSSCCKFYHHPQNRFWKILANIYNTEWNNIPIRVAINRIKRY